MEYIESNDDVVVSQEYVDNIVEFAKTYDGDAKTKELEKTLCMNKSIASSNGVTSGKIEKRRGFVAKRRGGKGSATITKYFNKLKI